MLEKEERGDEGRLRGRKVEGRRRDLKGGEKERGGEEGEGSRREKGEEICYAFSIFRKHKVNYPSLIPLFTIVSEVLI